MASPSKDHLKQLDELLATSNQSWLFGAGISVDAGVPLMGSLTTRVLAMADAEKDKTTKKVLEETKALLPPDSNIEHILSHLCDYVALAERSTNGDVLIGKTKSSSDDLRKLHAQVLEWIAKTVRWGYVPVNGTEPEKVGSRDNPIVKIHDHQRFMQALFHRAQAGIAERRSAVKFFTTNYDTLLEDALSLCCLAYWDGVAGGAVGYRNFHYGEHEPKSGFRAHVIKLHGSIDWHLGDDDRVWRVRDGDCYPETSTRVLIYPQATKYLATQRDPFAAQFDLFRRTLGTVSENVLAVCGYSCGDEHINQEIELALQRTGNKTTLLVFLKKLNPKVEAWRNAPWAERLYTITEDGLYVGAEGPFAEPLAGRSKHEWWKFCGITDLLSRGAEACVA